MQQDPHWTAGSPQSHILHQAGGCHVSRVTCHVSRVTCHDQSQCLVQESLASPDTEEQVPFEAGVKRGKVFVPVLSAEEEAAQQKQAEIAEKVKLEADEEAALASASLKDSAANRLIGEVVQSRRRPLLGPSPG